MNNKTKSKKLVVGDLVILKGDHPFSGYKGEIVSFDLVMGIERPKIRLFDMQGHEVYVMKPEHMQVKR